MIINNILSNISFKIKEDYGYVYINDLDIKTFISYMNNYKDINIILQSIRNKYNKDRY